MNSNRTNRSWRLRQRPEGVIDENDLELVTDEIPEIQEGQVLAKTIYFSLDPTNRIWMSDIDQYMEPVEIGDIMRAGGSLAIVEESKVPHVKVGDIVQGGMVLDCLSILNNFNSCFSRPTLHFKTSKEMHFVRKKSYMAHYGNSCISNGFYDIRSFFAKLQFECVHPTFFHHFYSILYGFFFSRVRAIRHRGDSHCIWCTITHCEDMHNHLVDGDLQRILVAV